MKFITDEMEMIVIVLAVLVLILLIVFVMMTLHFRKLRKKYMRLIGQTNVPDFEQVILQLKAQIERLQHGETQQQQMIDAMKQLKGKLGIHRYNAFNERGSDLSFSLAIVDESQNGVVITGLHNREQSYLYAKPLEQGDSTYPLSDEEKRAIRQAAGREI